MIVKTIVQGILDNNNHLLIDENSKEAVLFDCSGNSEELELILNQYNAKLKYVLITHGHFDHILGLKALHEKFSEVPIYAPKKDEELINEVDTFVSRILGSMERIEVPPVTKYIDESENLSIGDKNIKIFNTPGHTKGGVCYFVDDKLFSGDTIFLESVGRTDLPGGSFQQLQDSVKTVLNKLDDNVEIFTGHGPKTTVGHEKQFNPIL